MFFTLIFGDFLFSTLAICVHNESCRKKSQFLQTVPTFKVLQFSLHIDARLEIFKQSANKLSQTCQSKSYIVPP